MIRVARKTGLVFFPAFDWAISPTHPEREERLLYTKDQLFEEGIMDLPEVVEYKPRLATYKDIARVQCCVPDIPAQITEAHLIACGGTLVLADALMNKEIDNGFALVRPPGHHSMRIVHGNRGFCNIHNEAIMIDYLRHKYGLKKIAVVDTDVHHGDGTQDIYFHDPDVLFISYHQDGRTLYPGTGSVDELGGPAAFGTTINLPLLPNTTDEGIHYLLDNFVLPLLEEFKPDLVVNSAGQDNHYTDPLANMRFTANGYARLNEKLKPDLAVLEGGYAIETALPYVNTGIILAMAGLDYSCVREPDYRPEDFHESDHSMEHIKKLIAYHQETWKNRQELGRERYKEAGDFWERERSIYYDTDSIQERQVEQVRICRHCPGYQKIRSTGNYPTGRSKTIYAVITHQRACPQCLAEAKEAYREKINHPGGLDVVYFQNKTEDTFRHYDAASQQETVY
jgi:acetoin utilization deacetylase AcuC-like enzyme